MQFVQSFAEFKGERPIYKCDEVMESRVDFVYAREVSVVRSPFEFEGALYRSTEDN